MSNDTKWIYEQAALRADKSNKRLFVIVIILLSVLLVTNGGWLYYTSQFTAEITTEIKADQQADADSNNYIIGGNYNASKTESDDN